MVKTKQCFTCKKFKSINGFWKKIRMKDGLDSYCKKCATKHHIEYNNNRPSEVVEHRKLYQKKYQKNWRVANKDNIKKHRKKWRKDNREKIRTKDKEYRDNNKEKIKQRKAMWFENNPDKIKLYRNKRNKNTKILHDTYIKGLLTEKNNLKHKDIPEELVEAKRQIVKLNRVIKGDK